jgi:hypothetical protein
MRVIVREMETRDAATLREHNALLVQEVRSTSVFCSASLLSVPL